ncbi:MAG: hypothetical protein ACRBCI_08940 [Cellvibrionaceae bacterium]
MNNLSLVRKLFITTIIVLSGLSSNAVSASAHSCPENNSAQKIATVIGAAVSVDGGNPLYCEYHYLRPDEKKTLVEYRDIDNQVFARKELDFSSSSLSPGVIQTDLRHNELRAVEPIGSEQLKVNYRKANTDKLKEKVLGYSSSTVVDAGFDKAIRQSWETLAAGEKIIVDFVSPVHLTSIKLSIKVSEGKLCRKYNKNESDDLCFLVRPNNAFANLFVKPLVLVYQRETQRLLTFSGSVNVTDEEGASLKAVINYSYF